MQLAAFALSTVILSGSAAAQEKTEKTQEFNFDPVVVTGLRIETTDLHTPAAIQVYTQEQLKATGAVNLFDALRFTNGINSYSYGPGGQAYGAMKAKIAVRGWEKGTLIMIDGAPINLNDSYSLDTLPIENIERVEIIKSASTVLYGNDASGGIINIITKKNPVNSVSVSMGEYGRTSTNLTVASDRFSLSGSLQHNDLLKGLSSNGIAFGDADNSSILWKYKINDKLTFMHQHTENDYKHQKFKAAGKDFDWNTVIEDADYSYKEDFLRLRYDGSRWKFNVYANQSDRDTIKYTNVNTKPKMDKLDNTKYREVGIDAQTNWKTPFASFIGGFSSSTQKYNVDDRFNKKNIDADRDSYALFLQSTKELGGNVTAIVGVRQEWVSSTNRKNLDALCPQFQLLKKLDESSSLYINADKVFKMPTFTQLYGSSSPLFSSNPDLKPEEGWNYEAGWKKVTSDSMLKLAVYLIDMDSINYKAVGDVSKPENNPFKNTGVEINYDKQINDRFSYNVGASYGDPKTQNNDGTWARKYARQQYTGGVKYSYERWQASLIGSITADRAGGWQNMIPVNLNVKYAMNKESNINVAVENLFNRQDIIGNWTSPASTRYYSLPRNVRVTYTQNF